MPKVVVQTIERLTMSAAPAAKTGRQRAASHNSGANKMATGPTVASKSDLTKIASPLTSASAATVNTPSASSANGGRSRQAEASSITNGATVMIPSPSDANQCCQIVVTGVDVLWNSLKVRAPPTPDTAAPMIAAATSPSTLRNLPSLKSGPK